MKMSSANPAVLHSSVWAPNIQENPSTWGTAPLASKKNRMRREYLSKVRAAQRSSKCSRRRTNHRKTTHLKTEQKLQHSRKEFQNTKSYSQQHNRVWGAAAGTAKVSVEKIASHSRTEEETHLIDLKRNLLYDNSACMSFSLLLLEMHPCPNVCTVHVKISVCEMNPLRSINASLPSDVALRCHKHFN